MGEIRHRQLREMRRLHGALRLRGERRDRLGQASVKRLARSSRQDGSEMAPEISLDNQRPAEYFFSRNAPRSSTRSGNHANPKRSRQRLKDRKLPRFGGERAATRVRRLFRIPPALRITTSPSGVARSRLGRDRSVAGSQIRSAANIDLPRRELQATCDSMSTAAAPRAPVADCPTRQKGSRPQCRALDAMPPAEIDAATDRRAPIGGHGPVA